MICILLRYGLSFFGFGLAMSTPSMTTEPLVGSISLRMHLPMVVFPEPDSPTSPNVSPFRIEKETPLTALTWALTLPRIPPRMGKNFTMSFTARKSSLDNGTTLLVQMALDEVPWIGLDVRWLLLPAEVPGIGATRMEPAPRRRGDEVGDRPRNRF